MSSLHETSTDRCSAAIPQPGIKVWRGQASDRAKGEELGTAEPPMRWESRLRFCAQWLDSYSQVVHLMTRSARPDQELFYCCAVVSLRVRALPSTATS